MGVREVVEAYMNGSPDARNRLRDLAESRVQSAAIPSSGGWFATYQSANREIRNALTGQLGKIEESVPRKRYRVLASKFAPPDPEAYRSEVLASTAKIISIYDGVIKEGQDALDALADSGAMEYADYQAAEAVRRFLESVLDSMRSALIDEGSSDLAALATRHDRLAEGLIDFTIAVRYAVGATLDRS